MEEKDSQTIGTWNAGSGVDNACGTLLFLPSGDAKGTAYEQPASCQDFFFSLAQNNEPPPSLMHGVQVASRIGESGQRWLYASETTMSIPEDQ